MSCSEVMYQAYYPYLYQRAGAAPAHPVPRAGPFTSPFGSAHQYDRFNVQRLQESSHPAAASSATTVLSSTAGTSTTGVVLDGSNGGGGSTGGGVYSNASTPNSPLRGGGGGGGAGSGLPHKEEDSAGTHDDSSEEGGGGGGGDGAGASPHHHVHHHHGGGGGGGGVGSVAGGTTRAQYVSTNCVVFTHYQGDAAAVVDEHFTKALDKNHNKETSPMSTRNFPPSFWNSAHYPGAAVPGGSGHPNNVGGGGDLYGQGNGGGGGGQGGGQGSNASGEHYHPGDWYHQYSQYHHHHHHHHANMAAQAAYGGLLLPGSRLHMAAAAGAAQCKAMDWQHPSLENPYTSYPSMSGLEAQVPDSSKDLYWF